jgi:hypothetical protein
MSIVELLNLPLVRFSISQPGHAFEVEHGLLQLQAHGRLTWLMSSRLGLGPTNDTSDIDASRIGSMGSPGEHLTRSVVAACSLSDSTASGLSLPMEPMPSSPFSPSGQQELDVFLREAEGLLAVQQGQLGLGCRRLEVGGISTSSSLMRRFRSTACRAWC